MSDSVWGDSTLVTGEAVALDMPAASLGLRALSGLLDGLFSVLKIMLMLAFAGLAVKVGVALPFIGDK